MNLTERQLECHKFICDFVDKNGISPSMREIQDALGIASLQNVFDTIQALEDRGFIKKQKYVNRGIEVLRLPQFIGDRTHISHVKNDLFMCRKYAEFLEDSDKSEWSDHNWVELAAIHTMIGIVLTREGVSRDGG